MTKYIPILFSTEMVQAILEGRKTQTRRTRGLDSFNAHPEFWNRKNNPIRKICRFFSSKKDNPNPIAVHFGFRDPIDQIEYLKCPYGKPGDVLWVRETFGWEDFGNGLRLVYKTENCKLGENQKWKPSIHMPKKACRLFLRITNIRCERLQDISEDDAKAEGVETKPYGSHPYFCTIDYSRKTNKDGFRPGFCADTGRQFRDSFKTLWQKINGEDSWTANPWVWVIEFEKIDKPANWPQ